MCPVSPPLGQWVSWVGGPSVTAVTSPCQNYLLSTQNWFSRDAELDSQASFLSQELCQLSLWPVNSALPVPPSVLHPYSQALLSTPHI